MPHPTALSPMSIRNVGQNRPHHRQGGSVILPGHMSPRRKTFSWFVVPPAALNRERNVNSPPANRARSSTRTDAGKLPTSSSGPDHMPVLVLFQSLPSAYTCAITAIDEQFDASHGTTISGVPVSRFRPLKPSAFGRSPPVVDIRADSFPLDSTCTAFAINSLRSLCGWYGNCTRAGLVVCFS